MDRMNRLQVIGRGRRGVAILVTLVAMTALFTSAGLSQDWSPRLAATYLDGRQEQWSAWPRAQSANGPCVSCHTGMTYLLARPALRRTLGEHEPTKHEVALLKRLRTNVGAKPAFALRDVEVIFAALFLAEQDAGTETLSAEGQKAFDQLWALQVREGDSKGAWGWYKADLDPWETQDSKYYGAALAALAVGTAPPEYRNRPETKVGLALLSEYLRTGFTTQPLHNRLALLWASSRLPDLLSLPARHALINEVFNVQSTDGGWTIESLGPWQAHADAASADGSNGYATAFITFVLQEAHVARSDARLIRALQWLRARQDGKSGAWMAGSMNKRYPANSMEASFMQDAATAFATAALLGER